MKSYQTNQKQVYDAIAEATGVKTAFHEMTVEQTPAYLKEPVRIADFAVGVIAAFGANVVETGMSRGLPNQDISLDRRHATLSFNDPMYHFMNGVVIQGGEITVPVNGIYETKDHEWILFNGAYPHLRDGILNYFDAPHNQDALINRVSKHERAKIEEDFDRLGLCCAPVYTHEEWLEHPQAQVLSKQPIIEVERYGDARKRILPEAKKRPLEGVRVLDVTHVIAGPWASRLLAAQGADVISIKNGAFPFLYPATLEMSYGKKEIFLDFKGERDKAHFAKLIESADVLLWGYNWSSLDRLGFTLDALRELNPNLVLARECGYGRTGPWASRKGWEQTAQACCGAAALASQNRDQHHIIAALPVDFGTGYNLATGVTSALRHRQEQGGFWTVDTTLCSSIMLALDLPHERDEAVPVSNDDMLKYLVDQDADFGATLTRLGPVARLSKTPSFFATGPAMNGAHHPYRTTWGPMPGAASEAPHRPSAYAKEGLTGALEGYGHEDIMLRPR